MTVRMTISISTDHTNQTTLSKTTKYSKKSYTELLADILAQKEDVIDLLCWHRKRPQNNSFFVLLVML